MDKNVDIPLQEHETLVDLLLARCEALDRKVAEYERVCTELRETVKKKEEEYEDLNSKFRIYKMSMSLKGGTRDSEEMRRYLSHMIKEIDTCIAMLNE
jgi:phage shock protein A